LLFSKKYYIFDFMKKIMAIMALAIFAFSCSQEDGDENGGSSSLSGLISSSSVGDSTKDSFIDSRDGQPYNIVKIGGQWWMAENLNYETPSGSMCYDDSPANCAEYGRLYNWEAAMAACHSGWSLPSDADWDALLAAVGGGDSAGKHLKATSGWDSNGNGLDTYGFAALPGGQGLYGSDSYGFYMMYESTNWWSSTEDSDYSANYRYTDDWRESVAKNYSMKEHLHSVRCVQN
jgi:uncharacterized protein (TIGR02145 family)